MPTIAQRRRLAGLLTAVSLVAAGGLATETVAAPAAPPSDTSPKVKTRNPAKIPRVVDARFGKHKAYDRVVFDLTGKASGYNVRYVSTLRQCGSGKKVTIPGKKFLSITLEPAQAHDNKGRDVYRGPGQNSTANPKLPTLRSMRMLCDFEGQVAFGLGLKRKAGFRVGTLSKPTRIYVDVAH
ncbi:hypothetical protein GCM10009547_41280 [Sporichthya brevicatena]|uniref:AMIN-like domain-containing protein n=1 Tax=Sporichthya brevicatena TaxID=171442 RepID=A0ABP3SH46_9ACTN